MDHEINLERIYSVLRDITASLHPETTVKKVLNTVVQKSAEALNAKGAVIHLLKLETNELTSIAAYGVVPSSKEITPADLIRDKKIIVIRDILRDPRISYPREAWAAGIRMAIDAPLIIDNNTIGMLRVYFAEGRDFSAEELNFMMHVAEQGAFAIDRAQLLEGQRSRYDLLALQTEKLSALGRMAAGIAHEINNPLAGILLFSTNMLKKVPQDGPIREGLELIVQETIRCKRIIQELLEFSRESEPQIIPANINEILEKALRILENEFRLRHIRLEKHLDELPSVPLDKDQIEQVFVNLILNAIQAVDDQGVITVRSYVTPGQDRVKLEISDTGCGIPAENMSKIFEPFFSTKAKGTGLGLAVSYGIIRKHRGSLHATSGPGGKGSLFSVAIPISPPPDATTAEGEK